MTIMEKVLSLHEVDLFTQMDTEELSILAAIAEEDHFDPGEAIFQENEPADSLYLIVSGQVVVQRDQQKIYTAGGNDTLGAMSILDTQPWLFSAQAKEPTHLLRIDRETFLDLIVDHPAITRAILSTLVRQVRRLVDNRPNGGKSS